MELQHVVSEHLRLGDVLLPSSIFLFGQFTLIPCSSSYSPCVSFIILWFGVVYSRSKKNKPIKSQIYTCSCICMVQIYRYTLESCFYVDFRLYHFLVIMFLCQTFRSQFSCKIFIRKKKHKNLSVNHLIILIIVMFSHNNCHIIMTKHDYNQYY